MENTCNILEQSLTSNRGWSIDSLHTVHGVVSPNISIDIDANENREFPEIVAEKRKKSIYISLCSCIYGGR